jgi:hypothetical protein
MLTLGIPVEVGDKSSILEIRFRRDDLLLGGEELVLGEDADHQLRHRLLLHCLLLLRRGGKPWNTKTKDLLSI